MKSVSPELVSILVCPQCRHAVRLDGAERLVCTHAACGLRYPVRDGIPVMLVEAAEAPDVAGQNGPVAS